MSVRKKMSLIGVAGLISLSGVVYATEMPNNKTKDEVMNTFQSMFRGTEKPSKIEEVPIDKLYEVTAGDNVFYFSPKEGVMILGEMWSKDGVNLTAEKRRGLIEGKIDSLPLDKAIKIGNGPIKIIEVTDPDCPYCRKVDKALESRKDITRYIFFMPLRQIHPQAANKAAFIASQPELTRENAFRDVFAGKYDSTPVPVTGAAEKAKVAEMEKIAGSLGVRGTPALWINKQMVSGADIPRINSLLSSATGGKEAAANSK